MSFSFVRAVQGRRDSNPRPSVLETDALPTELLPSGSSQATSGLTGLLVEGVATLAGAVFLHLQALAVVDFGLHGDVVPLFALGAFERDLHPLVALGHGWFLSGRKFAAGYLMIFVTRPAPTVRPPSRIAKRKPSSIAIGLPSSTFIVTLSPGITISVPDGN
jgi:hypothetical protein